MFTRLWQWLGWEHRDVSYADPALAYLYGGSRTASGEPVSVERAVGLTAIWACVNLIAGSIASMPLVLYRRVDEERERALEHPLYDVLRVRPNPVQSVMAFWESMAVAILLRGNGYAMLTRDDDSRVRAMWYVNPDRVQVEVLRTARLRYKVFAGAATQTVDAANMLHIPGPMSDDGYNGRSVIGTFRETLGAWPGARALRRRVLQQRRHAEGDADGPGTALRTREEKPQRGSRRVADRSRPPPPHDDPRGRLEVRADRRVP
jgi:HK97 family phage portal protein